MPKLDIAIKNRRLQHLAEVKVSEAKKTMSDSYKRIDGATHYIPKHDYQNATRRSNLHEIGAHLLLRWKPVLRAAAYLVKMSPYTFSIRSLWRGVWGLKNWCYQVNPSLVIPHRAWDLLWSSK